MRNLTDFALRLEYERAKDLGDKLVDIGGRLNWESFRPPLEAMYRNNTECGGRPNLVQSVSWHNGDCSRFHNDMEI